MERTFLKDNQMKKNVTILTLVLIFIVAGFTNVSQIIKTFGSVSPTVGNRLVYNPDVTVLANPYMRLYKTQTDQLWDENATDLGPGATVTWANSAITIVDWTATRGGMKYELPTSSNLDDGYYDLTVYDNAVPASSDMALIKFGRYCLIIGNNIQTMDDL